jgi:ubiquinone/menaquinone biosynthesis C-methylase UbiE
MPTVAAPGAVWADLGAGMGAFTMALADLLGPTTVIYAVDQDRSALQAQQRSMRERFPQIQVHYVQGDFTRRMALPPLDGMVMANALHFVSNGEKAAVLSRLINYLKPGGRFILVEYNVDRGNMWVPYPLAYATWEALATRAGLTGTRLLATAPSRFLGQIYSAASDAPMGGRMPAG